MACLTESAAADTAAEELKIYAVMYYLGRGHNGLEWEMHLIKVGNNALCNPLWCVLGYLKPVYRVIGVEYRLIKARHIHTADMTGFFQEIRLAPAVFLSLMQELQKLVVHFLALAEQKNVNKIRHRLRIEGSSAAHNDKR